MIVDNNDKVSENVIKQNGGNPGRSGTKRGERREGCSSVLSIFGYTGKPSEFSSHRIIAIFRL